MLFFRTQLLAILVPIFGLLLVMVVPAMSVELVPADLVGSSGEDTVLALSESWRFHPGDDPAWADLNYDDSQWRITTTLPLIDDSGVPEWSGIGWFRQRLEVDSALWGIPLAIRVDQIGASEVYLDGELIITQGEVGASAENERIAIRQFGLPQIITFTPRRTHLLAVRYSNHHLGEAWISDTGRGFSVMLGRGQDYFRRVYDVYGIAIRQQMFISVMAITLTLLHVLMFIFYPASKENLYFAVLTFGIAGIAFIPTQMNVISSLTHVRVMLSLMKLSLILTSIFGIRLMYALFYTHLPRPFWVFAIIGSIMMVFSWYLTLSLFYYLGIAALLTGVLVNGLALIRGKPGAKIIGTGFAAFAGFSIYQMLSNMGFLPQINLIHQPYMIGILIMLISVSIYLARDFTRQSLELRARLNEVQELSDKNLRQERQAKEQEIRQKLLEADIDHQKKQLGEAKKLEKALADLERANYELRTTQGQLVQSEKMASLGQLVAGIAHEINTPIGAAGSMHDTLKRAVAKIHETVDQEGDRSDRPTDQSLHQLLDVIDEANTVISSAVDRVTDIVRRLKSFARLDEAELKTADIHEGLDDTLVLLHHEMKHGIKVDKNYGEVGPIACFPGRLNQVFLNLLVNAVHAMHGKGEITIITKTADGKIYIVIKDRGEGIPEESLSKIFDPGYTTKGVGVGTGLGLSICYQIIQDHHGEIKATSRVGAGTTFTIILPTDLDKILNIS